MHRIKRIEDVIIPLDMCLLEIVLKDGKQIILLNNEGSNYDYLRVAKVGDSVTRFQVGDIVLDIPNESTEIYKISGKDYIKVFQNRILLAVKPDNFDKDKRENVKSTLLS